MFNVSVSRDGVEPSFFLKRYYLSRGFSVITESIINLWSVAVTLAERATSCTISLPIQLSHQIKRQCFHRLRMGITPLNKINSFANVCTIHHRASSGKDWVIVADI
jgi:hypothetical protein